MSPMAFVIVTGVVSFVVTLVHEAIIAGRARKRRRLVEAAAVAEAEAAMARIDDRLNAGALASLAAFEEHQRKLERERNN